MWQWLGGQQPAQPARAASPHTASCLSTSHTPAHPALRTIPRGVYFYYPHFPSKEMNGLGGFPVFEQLVSNRSGIRCLAGTPEPVVSATTLCGF